MKLGLTLCKHCKTPISVVSDGTWFHDCFPDGIAHDAEPEEVAIKLEKSVWVDAEISKPPRQECFGDFWRSEPVLIVVDGKRVFVGYYQSWDEEPQWNTWKLAGRDSPEVKVTHWMPLPPLPNVETN